MAGLRDYFRQQHLAILSFIVALAGFLVAYETYKAQNTFIQIQGENLRVEFKRYSLFSHDPIEVIGSDMLSSKWHITIHNTSIQTTSNIVGYEIYKGSGRQAFKITSEQNHVRSYTPFSSADDGKAVLLPISIPPGSSISLRMNIDVRIAEDAAQFLKSTKNEMDVDRAASLYSWHTHEQGDARDIFGSKGFDNGGFSLNVFMRDQDRAKNPDFHIILRTNRGNRYAGSATWYYMMTLIPDDPKSPPLMVIPGISEPVPFITPSSAR